MANHRIIASLALAALIGACGSSYSSSGTSGISQTMAKAGGDGQTVTAGSTVTIRPAIKITDQNGAAISGVAVSFSVATGNGSITGGTTATGSDGVATVGSWILGLGTNTLTASAANTTGSPLTFTATGTQ